MARNKETVRISIDIPAEQHAYLMLLATGEGLSLEKFVLKRLPTPEDQMQLAEKILRQNREALKKLSKD